MAEAQHENQELALVDLVTRISVEPSPLNGLDQPSRLMVDKVTTMPRRNLQDRLGRLLAEDLVRLNRALIVFLGLAD